MNVDTRHHSILFDPEIFRTGLAIRLLDVPMLSRLSGVSIDVLYDILSRRARRNADGLVPIEAITARKITLTMASIDPIVIPSISDQGPRRLPDEVVKRNARINTCPHCGGAL
jgi:acetaldehyde dehydrogenase (acetylating)